MNDRCKDTTQNKSPQDLGTYVPKIKYGQRI